ncbi:polyprenyl synthetase family protein [Geobacter pickeringii]|uniref:Octaprenyl diphosphate synthase n=1 Tax=Geobacter pickeringii TaxID=345632 RepID=A0A0B5BCV7_9BACT|nr:polyprenyl synthetase family protein [Geobacter pickeringii]AJE02919.1 octaprenyl diphosphate synthase [Geobacter pickeringii]
MHAALALVGEDLKNVELQFRKDLESDVYLIRKVGEYVLASGGKRIRPALLLLSSKLCGYQGDRHVPLASVIEFIHTATLLHDDVVDNATLRRGNASANEVWGNEASVLVGDFLFSKSFSLMVDAGDLQVLKVMSNATTIIAEGEVLQLLCTSDLEMSHERYIEVVKSKTAVLLSAACEAGAILGGVSPEQVAALRDYGMDLGIAFQLMDDTLDYTAVEEQFGKEIGHDLEEGKITLPLIHTLRRCTDEERETIAAIVEKDAMEPGDFESVFTLVHKYGGIQYTTEVATEYTSRCKSHLNVFPDSSERDALIELADYVVSRKQ